MNRRPRSPIASAALALALALVPLGCGDANDAAKAVAVVRPVQDVGDLYRMAILDRKKPPTGPADFRRYQDANPEAARAVESGEVVVIWGVNLADLSLEGGGDAADEVLAYEKKAPEEGGLVLMKNRKVRTMTADEFKAARKAVGKS